LGKAHKVKDFAKCDFTRIAAHLDKQKLIKKAATDGEKAARKESEEGLVWQHGFALVDGDIQKLGNFRTEPPGLFRGRGAHPLTGKIKTRSEPEHITLNIGTNAPAPRCPVVGHTYKAIVHKPDVTWLAQWIENVNGQNKYVQLAASSAFKGRSDVDKFDKAIRLVHHIDKIRADYTKKLSAKSVDTRQIGTAVWIIDILALRVGGEKGDDEADTVGCCSLRVEHFTWPADEAATSVDLEFLGKDSMTFKQTVDFDKYGETGLKVLANLRKFVAGKRRGTLTAPGDQVFDKLSPDVLNSHFRSQMKGLSAKVFRTYNASVTLERELPKTEAIRTWGVVDKVLEYDAANRTVAILCNHQKTVAGAVLEGIDALKEKLQMLKDQRAELVGWGERVERGKSLKVLKDASAEDLSELSKKQTEKAKTLTAAAVTEEEKIAATEAKEEAARMRREAVADKQTTAHQYSKQPTHTQVKSRIEMWDKKIATLELSIRNKDDNKEVALGTSKINYMDPRVSVAWCKRNEVPIEKIFSKTLRDKFPWAMAVPPDWEFK